MRKGLWHMITLAAVVLAIACTNEKQDAEQQFMEAEGLAQSAQAATGQSFSEGLKLYEDAAGKAVAITERYPDLELAKGLSNGEKRVGPNTLQELRKVIIPKLKAKAAAERDFLTY